MPRSWTIPVAQALQRHTGGWVFKPVALSDRLEFPDIFILQSK